VNEAMLERASFNLVEVKFDTAASEPGTFAGYGAIFGNLDGRRDLIKKGAFKESLRDWKRDRKKLPKMLLQHGGGFMGAADDLVPIGQWTRMEEDDNGLLCEGKLFAMDTDRGKYIHAGLTSGELDGLSIGYEVKDFENGTKPEEPRRTLKKIDLWEVSVVTFPMNRSAIIAEAKSIDELETLADVESLLREAAGMSKTQATALVARIKTISQKQRGEPGAECDLTGLRNAVAGARAAFRS
jgi:HK97 family phage prohead protease